VTSSVSGRTRLLGIVGHPIAQVRAPGVWTDLFHEQGIEAVCLPMQVQPADLRQFITAIGSLQNLIGLIVTIPHKQAVLTLTDEPSPRACRAGVVNIMKRVNGGWAGDTLDGVGFVRGLQSTGQSVAGRRTLIVGCGGVGSAIALEAAAAGAAEVVVADILPERAQELAERIAERGTPSRVGPADPAAFDVVVNATPAGMRPDDPLPMPCDSLRKGTLVADVVVQPEITPFLAAALERGCVVQPGRIMSDLQIPVMAEFFGIDIGNWTPDAGPAY
jgi:shikimate dehydrogenase